MLGRVSAADNHVVLEGQVRTQPKTRVSPAGVPIARFSMDHVSRRPQAGQPREVRCRIQVVVAGEGLDSLARGLQRETRVRITGFLASAGHRAGEYEVVLNAEHIEVLD